MRKLFLAFLGIVQQKVLNILLILLTSYRVPIEQLTCSYKGMKYL